MPPTPNDFKRSRLGSCAYVGVSGNSSGTTASTSGAVGGVGQNLTRARGLGKGLAVCERLLGIEGERLRCLFDGFGERWRAGDDAGEVREECPEVGVGLFADDGDVVLPHGALPHARRRSRRTGQSSWHLVGEFFGRSEQLGCGGAEARLGREPLGPSRAGAENQSRSTHGTNSGAMLSHRPARFVDDARAVFGNRTTI